MKKIVVYTITAILSLSILAGCGRMGDKREDAGSAERPMTSASPMIVTPDPEDGVVRDEDGIITEGDPGRGQNGGGTGIASAAPAASASPTAAANPGTAKTPAGTNTASPSPSAAE